MRILMVTSEWPTPEHPDWVPFLVQQVQHLRRAGIEVEVFTFRGNKRSCNYLRTWLRLRRQYSLERFDLLHAQFGQSGLLALPVQVPLVVTFHGSDLLGFTGPKGQYRLAGMLLRLLSQGVARAAQEIIVVAEHLTRFLPREASVHIIPCGIDFELFRPMPQAEARRQLRLPLDRRLILFAANPQRSIKRYPLAQQAVAQLNSSFEVELITLSGVPHPLVPIYMNACDVLVLTSKHEGSPTVIKEALACNLPVVSVDVGDVRQRIGAVDGCVICPDDQPETIAAGLAQVLGRQARIDGRSAVRDLDEHLLTQKIISVYEKALAYA